MSLIDRTWLRKNISKLDVTAAEIFETGKHRTKTERNRTEYPRTTRQLQKSIIIVMGMQEERGAGTIRNNSG